MGVGWLGIEKLMPVQGHSTCNVGYVSVMWIKCWKQASPVHRHSFCNRGHDAFADGKAVDP